MVVLIYVLCIGIVHDAIASATYLKFHPKLPKQGTRVVTRPAHDASHARLQRHSVEVSNASKHCYQLIYEVEGTAKVLQFFSLN